MTASDLAARARTAPRRRRRSGGLALPLAVLATLAVTAVAYIAYVLWPRWPEPPVASDAPALPVTVAGVAFNLPPGAIRVPVQRHAGTHDRIDLAFQWPSLEPPTDPNRARPTAETPSASLAAVERVFVTIAAAGDTLAPDERVKTIYSRYASETPVAGPPGLAVLAFRQDTPYQGEDLVYDAQLPANFLVRCSRNGAGATPGICLFERRIESADIIVRFPRDWLARDWHAVADGIERLLTRLRAAAG
jgi:hypothetical protein